jgi:elongation factor Tu
MKSRQCVSCIQDFLLIPKVLFNLSMMVLIQVFRKSVPRAVAGENVGILLRGIKREFVERGMYLGSPGQLRQSDRFSARLYILTRAEGGRSKPLCSGFISVAHVDTWTMAAMVRLRGGEREMAMPGDLIDSAEILLRRPMVLAPGQRFVIRDNLQTIVSGVVTELLPMLEKHDIAGFNSMPTKPYSIDRK